MMDMFLPPSDDREWTGVDYLKMAVVVIAFAASVGVFIAVALIPVIGVLRLLGTL
jgi:hypothetical protein